MTLYVLVRTEYGAHGRLTKNDMVGKVAIYLHSYVFFLSLLGGDSSHIADSFGYDPKVIDRRC